MGWKGTLRSVNASMKKAEKENQRLRIQEIAFQNVQNYENYIDQICSVHKYCCNKIDWVAISKSEEPIKPIYEATQESIARYKLKSFKPNFLHKLFNLEKRAITKLEKNINSAIKKDKVKYEKNIYDYFNDFNNWENKVLIAKDMLNKDLHTLSKIIETQSNLIDENLCFSFMRLISSNKKDLIVDINVHGTDIVPSHSQTLTSTGKLSTKVLPKSTFYKIYQDYVCSVILRVARELFAISIFDSIIINATDDLVNTATGNTENITILSVGINRAQIEQINFTRIDSSDAITNFIHNMNFKKTNGFAEVEKITL